MTESIVARIKEIESLRDHIMYKNSENQKLSQKEYEISDDLLSKERQFLKNLLDKNKV